MAKASDMGRVASVMGTCGHVRSLPAKRTQLGLGLSPFHLKQALFSNVYLQASGREENLSARRRTSMPRRWGSQRAREQSVWLIDFTAGQGRSQALTPSLPLQAPHTVPLDEPGSAHLTGM